MVSNGFHVSETPKPVDQSTHAVAKLYNVVERDLRYRFATHYHPYVGALTRRLLVGSVGRLQAADTATVGTGPGEKPELYRELFTPAQYAPTTLVTKPWPVADLAFGRDAAYGVYNWELFYHVPITVGIHLSRNQRFADAMRWFHYVFDPTDDSDGPTPQRFWKVREFQTTDVQLIEEILVNLATGADTELRDTTISAINSWKEAPFRPHLVARSRPTAFMFKAVMAYLDNLFAWGDHLYRQDTGESINEATQLYVLAANILGPRPQEVPRKGFSAPKSYADLRPTLDEFSNAAAALEAEIPFDLDVPSGPMGDAAALANVRTLGASLYFCIPPNEQLIGYWDTVADRLFKIRNSLNLQGVFRQLPLFEPPIDPALLARAVAAGLDIGAAVAGLNQPLPLVRFMLLVQKAQEICQQVITLGANLLGAIEKEDGEALARLRAMHERTLLGLGESVRYHQWQEAVKNREAIELALANATHRHRHYERLLGTPDAEIKVPGLAELGELDTAAIQAMQYKQTEPGLAPRVADIQLAPDLGGDAAGRKLNAQEREELDKLADARDSQTTAAGFERAANVASYVPTFETAAKPVGVGAAVKFGGPHLAFALNFLAGLHRSDAEESTYEAGRAAKLGSYARREQDWALQSGVAAGDIALTLKQLRAAQIREAIAEREFVNHQAQLRQAEDIEVFLGNERRGNLRVKQSNEEFYAWLKRELRGLYNQSFQFAFDTGRKAERALQHELGDPGPTFLQYGYTAGKEGLLAGERLQLDLKRMELAYHELNHREYELTKHVSLREVDPLALLELRATGRCTVRLSEDVFDVDCPGHYFRRLRSVTVTIPAVVGPHASVNCTLTLLRSSVRTSPLVGDGYARDGEDPQRFSDYFGSLQSIVTSTAQHDAGVFDASGGDARYLPFEGSGAISEWQLDLPVAVPQFDLDTIADVILSLRLTAREGGQVLRDAAVANLTDAIRQAASVGSVRLLSVRHDFPTEWAQFTGTPLDQAGAAPLALTLGERHYPYWSRILGADLTLHRVDLFAASGGSTISVYDNAELTGTPDELVDTDAYGAAVGHLTSVPPALGVFTRHLTDNTMRDIWIALTWGEPT